MFAPEIKLKANLKSEKTQVIKKNYIIFLFTHLLAHLGKSASCKVVFYFPIISERTLEYLQERNPFTLTSPFHDFQTESKYR